MKLITPCTEAQTHSRCEVTPKIQLVGVLRGDGMIAPANSDRSVFKFVCADFPSAPQPQ